MIIMIFILTIVKIYNIYYFIFDELCMSTAQSSGSGKSHNWVEWRLPNPGLNSVVKTAKFSPPPLEGHISHIRIKLLHYFGAGVQINTC